ncbi:hypothetical protein BGZ61DRAFT_528069 [Ilyonectria robusta]|uniref:uncharacterized protein n=1 Tax=Ilyonectria robusta TaxID=1079257 RepID=UPI001E8D4E7E|nr:uncharacterized protein BGZ61DRAFT_528069 [Ilyonectria robusta]KAH8734772.1 hypothetical protein BGZ61DRAFT_528069 [Ilyonectria robusta]
MVYDWDVHQKTCYQLYIDEGRSLEDIMDHLRAVYKFTPSKRAFQTQFRRWNFPPKQKPAHKNDRLVNRVRDLWEKNLPQREMLRVLNEEDGFDIKPRELMRVRTRNRWLLRVPNGDKSRPLESNFSMQGTLGDSSPAGDGDSTLSIPEDQGVSLQPASEAIADSALEQQHFETSNPLADKDGKKKRTRNRQPTNPMGSPCRFPSETTIDEARVILNLEVGVYREIRSSFQGICKEEGVSKKTIAGVDRWDAVKDRLIHECPRLQQVIWGSDENLEAKRLALDVICTDVTKRMRTKDARMTLAEAKNALGVNPEESREIRFAFHQVLRDAQFTCKSDATPREWEELKRRWVEKSVLIKNMATFGTDPASQHRARALEVLARDVMKRMRDDRSRKGSMKKELQQLELQPQPRGELQQQHQESHHSTTPPLTAYGIPERRTSRSSQVDTSPQTERVDLGDGMGNNNFDAMSEVSHASQMPFAPPAGSIPTHMPMSLQSQSSSLSDPSNDLPQPHRVLGSSMPTAVPLDSQIGSSLFLAANTQAAFMDQQYVQQPYATAAAPSNPVFHAVPPMSSAIAVFLRLHPSSTFVTNLGLWIATLTSQSLQELRHTAVEKFPGALCVRIEGIVKDGKGAELPLQIEDDQELGAYLAHLQGGTPTFAVQLVWKT